MMGIMTTEERSAVVSLEARDFVGRVRTGEIAAPRELEVRELSEVSAVPEVACTDQDLGQAENRVRIDVSPGEGRQATAEDDRPTRTGCSLRHLSTVWLTGKAD